MIHRMRAIHWFRSDLRLRDNTALAAAAARADEIALVFVFDDRLLSGSRVGPPRLRFLWDALERLAGDSRRRGHRLLLRRGDPVTEIPRLLRETGAELLSFNRDPGPYAKLRDARVRDAAQRMGVRVIDCKDRVLFESAELRTRAGRPFRVFTPFRKAWLARLREDRPLPLGSTRLPPPIPRIAIGRLPKLADFDAAEDRTRIPRAGEAAARGRLQRFLEGRIGDYASRRDDPAVNGTSRLSPYLRFGQLSPRICVEAALEVSAEFPGRAAGAWKWIDELIWREFYSAILEEHPRGPGSVLPARVPERSAGTTTKSASWPGARAGPAILSSMLRCGSWRSRVGCTTAPGWWWRAFSPRISSSTGGGVSGSSCSAWSTVSRLPTMAAGNGRPPPARMRSPTSASSTRSLRASASIPAAATCGASFPSCGGFPTATCTVPGNPRALPPTIPRPIVEHAHQRQLALARYQAARRKAPRR